MAPHDPSEKVEVTGQPAGGNPIEPPDPDAESLSQAAGIGKRRLIHPATHWKGKTHGIAISWFGPCHVQHSATRDPAPDGTQRARTMRNGLERPIRPGGPTPPSTQVRAIHLQMELATGCGSKEAFEGCDQILSLIRHTRLDNAPTPGISGDVDPVIGPVRPLDPFPVVDAALAGRATHGTSRPLG